MNYNTMLKKLISLDGSLKELRNDVEKISWDSTEELVSLESSDIISVLQRYKQGNLCAEDVEEWANLLEGRDDIRVTKIIKSVVFTLANPAVEGALSPQIADSLIKTMLSNP